MSLYKFFPLDLIRDNRFTSDIGNLMAIFHRLYSNPLNDLPDQMYMSIRFILIYIGVYLTLAQSKFSHHMKSVKSFVFTQIMTATDTEMSRKV